MTWVKAFFGTDWRCGIAERAVSPALRAAPDAARPAASFRHPAGWAVRGTTLPFVDQTRIARQTMKRVVRAVLADGAVIGLEELNAELTRRVLNAYQDAGPG